ncbi:MAG: carbohydrate ABC transporter permease [Clostridiales bacterium]|nr:carbohydrate ABC transporter permease [Clostridiales bacterium]
MMNEQQNNVISKPVKKKSRLMQPHERGWVQAILISIITFCLIFSFLSLFLTIVNSMKTDTQVRTNAFGLPQFSTMIDASKHNFGKAWSLIGDVYFPTIAVSLVGAVGKVVISILIAYIFTFKDFYFKNFIFMVFISILLVPSIIGYPILVPLIRDSFGMFDTYVGYLLPIVGGGQVIGMFLFRTFFSQQPKSLYESARLDGANDFILITRITIPLAFPIILYHFIGSFSSIYNEYLWASLILRENQTLTSLMHSLVSSDTTVYGESYAMYVISSFPLIITTIISMKYFKSGEFAAGLKL